MYLRTANVIKKQQSEELKKEMEAWEAQPGNKVTIVPFGVTSGIIDDTIHDSHLNYKARRLNRKRAYDAELEEDCE